MKRLFPALILTLLFTVRSFATTDALWPEVEDKWSPELKKHVQILKKLGKLDFTIQESRENVPKASVSEQERGYLLFSKPYWERFSYDYVPAQSELDRGITINAAKGEYEPFSVGLFPLRDQTFVEFSVDDFRNESGGIISKSACTIEIGKYLLWPTRRTKHFSVKSGYLEPAATITLHQGITRQIWVTLQVPGDAASGIYKSRIKFSDGHRETGSLNIVLHVFPFALTESSGVNFGWFYSPQASLENELADLRKHGCTAVEFPSPPVLDVSPTGKVTLDFSTWTRMAEACRKLGMTGRHFSYCLTVARSIIGKGFREFSPEFTRAYLDAMSQIEKWLEKNNVNMTFWVVDEPREKNINAWNRNMADTLSYLELYASHGRLPNTQTMITIMTDENDGMDYTPMVPHMKRLFTHPIKRSQRLIQSAKQLNKPLEFFNAGLDRLTFGLLVWKHKAVGRWEWHYGFYYGKDPFNVFQFMSSPDHSAYATYPTKDHIYSTIPYELTAQGIDDYRYIAMLEQVAGLTSDKYAGVRNRALAVLKQMDEEIAEFPELDRAGGHGHESTGSVSTDNQRNELAEKFRLKIADVLKDLP